MSFVYVMTESLLGRVKIGSSGNPEQRRTGVESEWGGLVEIYKTAELPNRFWAQQAEQRAQHIMRRFSLYGEWFEDNPRLAWRAVKKAVAETMERYWDYQAAQLTDEEAKEAFEAVEKGAVLAHIAKKRVPPLHSQTYINRWVLLGLRPARMRDAKKGKKK